MGVFRGARGIPRDTKGYTNGQVYIEAYGRRFIWIHATMRWDLAGVTLSVLRLPIRFSSLDVAYFLHSAGCVYRDESV